MSGFRENDIAISAVSKRLAAEVGSQTEALPLDGNGKVPIRVGIKVIGAINIAFNFSDGAGTSTIIEDFHMDHFSGNLSFRTRGNTHINYRWGEAAAADVIFYVTPLDD